MPITPEKREKWLSQWPKDTQESFKANPYLTWLIVGYTQNIVNSIKTGGYIANDTPTTDTQKEEPKVIEPEPFVDDDDDADGDMFSLFD